MIPIRTGLDSRNDTVAEEEEFPDTQSRSKGFNKFPPPAPASLQNQPEGRFFYNFGNNNNGNKLFNIYNPFLKTSTFTLTLTITTISSVVTCVPSFQFLNLGIPAPPVVPAGRDVNLLVKKNSTMKSISSPSSHQKRSSKTISIYGFPQIEISSLVFCCLY